MVHVLSGHWRFGYSKLDLKLSSLRQVRSSDLKLASWLAELVAINPRSLHLHSLAFAFPPISPDGSVGTASWWPNQLNLKALGPAPPPAAANGAAVGGGGKSYAEEFNTLDLARSSKTSLRS